MNRYLALLLVAVAVGAGASLLSRAPRRTAAPVAGAQATPAATIEIEVRDGAIAPLAFSVPKDHRVVLRVDNRGVRPARLSLAGYQDRLDVSVPTGGSWRGEFLADRPGDDFAWLLDGAPVGRLRVQGSHLVEGHR